jgi:hypothetical protein
LLLNHTFGTKRRVTPVLQGFPSSVESYPSH